MQKFITNDKTCRKFLEDICNNEERDLLFLAVDRLLASGAKGKDLEEKLKALVIAFPFYSAQVETKV